MPEGASLATKLAAAAVVVVVLAGGFWLLARNVGEGTISLAIGIVWWLTVAAVALLLARRRSGLLVPVGAAIIAASVAGGAYIYPAGTNEVDEQIATGAPVAEASSDDERAGRSEARERREGESGGEQAGGEDNDGDRSPSENVELASGSFEGVSGHGGSGAVSVVELAEGDRVITFSEFEVDPGAGGQDLRIWLSAGSPQSDAEATADFVEIAPLRGERGDQQYELPDGVDLGRYSSVVIWCVPFTTRIAQAELE